MVATRLATHPATAVLAVAIAAVSALPLVTARAPPHATWVVRPGGAVASATAASPPHRLELDDHVLRTVASLLITSDDVRVIETPRASSATSQVLVASAAQASVKKETLSPRSWFAITFSFAFVIKGLCMLSNILFQVSPIPQVRQFSKLGDTGEADAAPFISILYGGCQWCFYGLFAFMVTKKSGFLVLVYSNVLGAFLGIYYIWGFQRNCRSDRALRKLFMYYQAACTLVVVQVIAIGTLPPQQALFFCGLVSSVWSVVGACSLLATLPMVLETKCSASINLPLLTVGVGSGILWLTCGFILWDAWIMVPNVICLVFQLLAIAVVFHFPRDPSKALPVGSASPSAEGDARRATPAAIDEEALLLPAATTPELPEVAAVAGGESPLAGGPLASPSPPPEPVASTAGVVGPFAGYGTMSILGETGGTP
mmetsp:Transcript_80390/g.172066  ORF Transcript_80390/g.172066 Transcript_80390/m.172066 type:complete len:428 (-) Transcript_80390:21-1304(-)